MSEIVRADDWYAQGFRTMTAREVEVGDNYLASYVGQVDERTCITIKDLDNGYIDIDGTHWLKEAMLWVRKNS